MDTKRSYLLKNNSYEIAAYIMALANAWSKPITYSSVARRDF
jgi:hypothetical protein